MSAATEFTLLRDIQRTLRLHEIAGRASDEAKVLRTRVLERMALIAPFVSALMLLLFVMPALAQEHQHGADTIYGATGRFYETWMRPDQPASSCCNRHDCDTAVDVKQVNGRWWARKKGGGPLMSIPPEKVEQGRDSPDGQSHICSVGSTVLCFLPGGGT
jgi:hypothetical protein